MKTAYSQKYHPPAPVLQVSLAAPEETPQLGPYSALVDTGADGTFVPTYVLESLEAPVAYMTRVRSHLGEQIHQASVHKVDLILLDSVRLPSVNVVSDDWGDQIIIGRNVLNLLCVFLDGPRKVTQVLE